MELFDITFQRLGALEKGVLIEPVKESLPSHVIHDGEGRSEAQRCPDLNAHLLFTTASVTSFKKTL